MRKFYIVNEIDAPTERLIAEERNGKLYYVHPTRADRPEFYGMGMESATPVEDFGVDLCIETGYPHGTFLSGIKTHPSVVKYKDGSGRRWQGSAKFRFELKNPQKMEDNEPCPSEINDKDRHRNSDVVDDGGPAFPQPDIYHANGEIEYGTRGMSLRDWFAGQALAGQLANPAGNRELNEEQLALYAFTQADAMLAARKEGAK